MMKSVVLFAVCALALVCFSEAAGSNPYAGTDYYINPDFVKEIQTTINANPSMAPMLAKVQNISVAYWIDRIARIGNITAVLDGAKAQQAKTGRQTVTTFIIYDLPNRDCAALSSNGEITCADSTCAAGLTRYETQYITPIYNIFAKYPNQPIVAIIEPDSLPNLATNMNLQKCAQAETAYINGVAYTIKTLSKLKNVVMYVDAAHGGWLGWDNNRVAAAQVFQKVLNLAGGANLIRGFASNTANYQPLGSLSSTADPCNLQSQYNKCVNEAIYINMMTQQLNSVGLTNMYWITDTSRNGVTNERHDCSNWCNIKGAGFGIHPTSSTSSTGVNNIDAFYWIKTPGESDGTSDSTADRYDAHCSSADSFTPSPQAGNWFPAYFIQLAQNANPPL